MKRKIEQEDILDVLEELRGNILIVEGKKDEKALRSLGMDSGCSRLKPRESTFILKINSQPIAKVATDVVSMAEKHKNREIIVLTDFDRTGRKMAAKIRLILQSRKIHANSRIRRDVMNLGIQRVEEMASLREALNPAKGTEERSVRTSSVSRKSKSRERDDYGEISANFDKVRGKSLHKGKRDNREA
jgi:5S rRNA maturation endonuclease (ribonuclease M5)